MDTIEDIDRQHDKDVQKILRETIDEATAIERRRCVAILTYLMNVSSNPERRSAYKAAIHHVDSD